MQSPSRLHGDGNWEERKTRKRASVTVPLTVTLARFLVLRSSSDFRGKTARSLQSQRLFFAYQTRMSRLCTQLGSTAGSYELLTILPKIMIFNYPAAGAV